MSEFEGEADLIVTAPISVDGKADLEGWD